MKSKISFFKKNHTNELIIFFALSLCVSCVSYKRTLYFQGDQQTLPPPNLSETYKLRTRDIVQIKISNPDSESSKVLTADDATSGTAGEDAYFKDYYINDSGYVELPVIGKLKLVDYTMLQADSIVSIKAIEYFSYVTVDVKLASFKFLAMGEFETPGQYFVANETCTIYEAIAIAGDAGEYGDKKNVQLIRTLKNGSKKIYHINLTDYSSFTSDNFYIQPNDILYIQPQHAKVAKQNIANISIALSAVSIILLILTRL